MANPRFKVWSYDPANRAWLVVDEGSEDHCRKGAERRNDTATRRNMTDVVYVALPAGQHPTPDDRVVLDDDEGPPMDDLRAAGERFLRRFLGGGKG